MLSKNLIKEVILEQRKDVEDTFKRDRIIERENIAEAKRYLKFPNILAILGIRRCGKSTFSWQIFSNNKFAYINFDDERLIEVTSKDLNKILECFYEIYGDIDKIILDEPQNIKGWELFANRLRRTKKVIITGSNSKLLSGELATALTGRHIEFTLFPFSFREYLNFKGYKLKKEDFYLTEKRAEIMKFLSEYLENGGMPERFKFGRKILREIYEDILLKDVIKRGGVKKEIELKKISLFLINNFSKEFTYKSLKNFVGVRHLSTISKWINLLQEAFLIFILERFSFKLKQPVYAPKKVYCIDNGIITSIGINFSMNTGRLMENVVGIELMRRKNEDEEFYYWKDYQQHEVDFVIKKGLKVKQLIQVSYASGRDEIEQREVKSLLKASDLLECKDLLVITWDYEGEEDIKGRRIRFIPLWKWLINYG